MMIIIKKIKFYLLLGLTLLSYTCKKETFSPQTIDYSYFPIAIGNSIIYEVKYIDIDVNVGKHDTTIYQIMELVESEFYDNENRKSYRIERYYRSPNNNIWTIKDIWIANLFSNNAQKVEENIRYIKLVFPASINTSWNGNAQNYLDEEKYTITSIDVSEKINNFLFDSVLTVRQSYSESLIHKIYKVEKYAKHIGMIYKVDMNIESQAPSMLPIEQRITKGTILTMSVSSYSIK